MLEDPGNRELLDRGGIRVQRLDLHLESRVGRGEDAVAAALVASDPVLPASRCHPEAVDEDDRVGCRSLGGHAFSFPADAPTSSDTSPDWLRNSSRSLPSCLVRIGDAVRCAAGDIVVPGVADATAARTAFASVDRRL